MQLTFTVPAVALEFDKALTRKVLRQAGREIANTARALIGRDASGRVYGQHTASAPGMPPASLTGQLAASLNVKQRGDHLTIIDGAYYAKFLETGAKGGGHAKNSHRVHKRGAGSGSPQTARVLEPRPFLSIAAEAEMPSLQKRIQAALAQGIDLKTLKAAR